MGTEESQSPVHAGLPIFVVSGGLGTSGEQLVRTILAQFPGVELPLTIVPHVRTRTDLQGVVERASAAGGMIVHTLVDSHLRKALNTLAGQAGIHTVDLMGDMLSHLAAVLGTEPLGRPGLYRQQREAYFERIEAIEFTVAHDDGQRINDLDRAQIVLVGVSRAGKTPLSVYLSFLGWKVANVPLVPEISPPPILLEVDRRRVIGLTLDPGQLVAHRLHRRQALGIGPESPYTDARRIYEEAEAARAYFRRHGFGIVDTTDKPIEASAEEVIALLTRRLRAPEASSPPLPAHNPAP